MTQNVIESSNDFKHIKSIFIQSALIELSRFSAISHDSGPSEQQYLLNYVIHCGKELKIHTLLNNLSFINGKIFNSDKIRTFVLCVADRFFVEIKPFEKVLYEHLGGIFHIKNISNVTVMHKDLLTSLTTDIPSQGKDMITFFEANSWIVCLLMLIITENDFTNKISVKNSKKESTPSI